MAARSEDSGGRKSAGVLRVVGVVALVATALAIGAVRMGFIHLPGSHDEDSMLAKGNPPVSPSSAKPPGLAGSGGNAEAVNLDAPAVEPNAEAASAQAESHRPGTRVASSAGSRAAAVTAVTPDVPRGEAPVAHLDEHATYQYNALGRRDPFQSLINGEFVGADVGGDAPPDPGGLKIVGIVWGASDQFAMV